MLWTAFFTFPLMVGIQTISARIGRVTGNGLAANIRRHYPPALLYGVVGLLLIANTINLAADIGAISAALKLLIGGSAHLYAVAFALLSLLLQIFIPFPRYAPILKVLTLALFAFVATVFVVKVPWGEVLHGPFCRYIFPGRIRGYSGRGVRHHHQSLPVLLAGLEVEELRAAKGEQPLKKAPEHARAQLKRIKIDTYIGMGFSNLVAFFIILTAAVTLNPQGITDIQTSAQAAEALRPIAGEFAFALFAAGIVGTGLLAVPILAGSAAYGAAEAFKWRIGLGRTSSRRGASIPSSRSPPSRA
ncbi:MAG: divalent metal cation transporter [Casimicrobiaceae bacterium]